MVIKTNRNWTLQEDDDLEQSGLNIWWHIKYDKAQYYQEIKRNNLNALLILDCPFFLKITVEKGDVKYPSKQLELGLRWREEKFSIHFTAVC